MKYGFIKARAATPKVVVSNTAQNADSIIKLIHEAAKDKVSVLVLPELCVTGYTNGDLFLQNALLDGTTEALLKIKEATTNLDLIVFVGAPIKYSGKLFNCAVVICNNQFLGLVPKTHIPNYSEFYELRHFTEANDDLKAYVNIGGDQVLLCAKQLFCDKNVPEVCIGAEICEDLWVPSPPSGALACAGATMIVNLSASNETVGKDNYRRDLVKSQSGRLVSAYIYADAGEGESTTDVVFSAHNMIAENGVILSEAQRFKNESASAEIDLQLLLNTRQRLNTFGLDQRGFVINSFEINYPDISPENRFYLRKPFVPEEKMVYEKRCEEILLMQAMGLRKRLEHIGIRNCVLGISGGLDSTLALLVACKAAEGLEGFTPRDITAITMPALGTTNRTRSNAQKLCELLGTTFETIDISEAVKNHFKDIKHDGKTLDVTFENAQARERTQVLMDIANKQNGIVVGTGDMSELALGFATYGGDHISMYGVNAGVPKTLVSHLIKYYADTSKDERLREVLYDIIDTPISPELLPPTEDTITQETEKIIGNYDLNDFFLYYVIRMGFTPDKIAYLAKIAYKDEYTIEEIKKRLREFYRRFFQNQFKRSCLPDGVKIGSIALSPRGDWRMPSDASAKQWLDLCE